VDFSNKNYDEEEEGREEEIMKREKDENRGVYGQKGRRPLFKKKRKEKNAQIHIDLITHTHTHTPKKKNKTDPNSVLERV